MVEPPEKVDEAFFLGKRVRLFCSCYDDGICNACTLDKGLPKMTLKVAFEKGVEHVLPIGSIFLLENFALSL